MTPIIVKINVQSLIEWSVTLFLVNSVTLPLNQLVSNQQYFPTQMEFFDLSHKYYKLADYGTVHMIFDENNESEKRNNSVLNFLLRTINSHQRKAVDEHYVLVFHITLCSPSPFATY